MNTPPQFTTLQVVAVQNLNGRKHDYVRVFGHDVNDMGDTKLVVEVALSPKDAMELIEVAARERKFPEIEVPERSIVKILNTDNIELLHIGQVGEDPRRNA